MRSSCAGPVLPKTAPSEMSRAPAQKSASIMLDARESREREVSLLLLQLGSATWGSGLQQKQPGPSLRWPDCHLGSPPTFVLFFVCWLVLADTAYSTWQKQNLCLEFCYPRTLFHPALCPPNSSWVVGGGTPRKPKWGYVRGWRLLEEMGQRGDGWTELNT